MIGAQAPAQLRLGAPEAELAEPLITVMGVRELPDGRALLVDSRRNAVLLADIKAGSVAPVGTVGEGAGQYCHPTHLIALTGDTTLVYDAARMRLVSFAPGSVSGAPFDLAVDSATRRAFMPRLGAGATDASGRLYFAGMATRREASGQSVVLDSVAIERWNRQLSRADTLGNLPPIRTPGPDPAFRPAPPLNPFPSGDQWAVSPDGRVAIVRVNPYRVEIADASGKRVVGRPLANTPIPVSDAERQQWLHERQFSGDGGVAPSRRANGKTVQGQCGALGLMQDREIAWPRELPPFPPDAVRFAPDGLLWVERSVPAGSPELFDVIDGEAKVVANVTMPPNTVLVGFGSTSLYAVRIDDSHAEFLQRYPLPKISGHN
ncbi:MAG TPA: hypothetical protein VGM67_17320 [Gemmatimonadaceae bacterium]